MENKSIFIENWWLVDLGKEQFDFLFFDRLSYFGPSSDSPKSFPKGQWVIGLSELILWDVFSGLPKKQSLTHLQKLILQVQMFKQKSHNFQWFNLRNYDIHQVNPFLTPRKTMKHPLLVSTNRKVSITHSEILLGSWPEEYWLMKESPKKQTKLQLIFALPYHILYINKRYIYIYI